MDQDLRDELDRLWAELKTLTALVASDIGARWDEARIAHWHENQIAHADAAMRADVAAGNQRALDNLAARMRIVARRHDGSGSRGS